MLYVHNIYRGRVCASHNNSSSIISYAIGCPLATVASFDNFHHHRITEATVTTSTATQTTTGEPGRPQSYLHIR